MISISVGIDVSTFLGYRINSSWFFFCVQHFSISPLWHPSYRNSSRSFSLSLFFRVTRMNCTLFSFPFPLDFSLYLRRTTKKKVNLYTHTHTHIRMHVQLPSIQLSHRPITLRGWRGVIQEGGLPLLCIVKLHIWWKTSSSSSNCAHRESRWTGGKQKGEWACDPGPCPITQRNTQEHWTEGRRRGGGRNGES